MIRQSSLCTYQVWWSHYVSQASLEVLWYITASEWTAPFPNATKKEQIRVNNLYSLVYPGPRGFPWFFSAWERCEAVKMNCDSCSLLCEKKPQKSRQKPLEPGCDFCQSVLLLEAMRIRTCMNWPESQESSWGETVDEEYWRHRMKELFSTFISLVKQA